MIPADFLAYVVDYIQTQRLQIPIGQVVGFQNFVSTQASVYQNSGQSLSGTFANGASASGAGPSVSVPSGKYVVLAGGDMATQFGNGQATLTVSPGGMVVRASAASTTSAGKATGLTMSSAGTISSTLFVAGDGSPTNVTSTISGAWLVAIRYDNA
jgi:PAB1-binding protein PBP1